MKGRLVVAAGLLAACTLGCTSAPPRPAADFGRGIPEEQGVSSDAISKLFLP